MVRVLISQALFRNPDLLIMDEPANYLDLESITAFSNTIKNFKGSMRFTTRDHEFAQRLGIRIIELSSQDAIDC